MSVSCINVCIPYGFLMPEEARKGVRDPGIGVTGGCILICRCWEPNSESLQEQRVFLTAKPSPQPLKIYLYHKRILKVCTWDIKTAITRDFPKCSPDKVRKFLNSVDAETLCPVISNFSVPPCHFPTSKQGRNWVTVNLTYFYCDWMCSTVNISVAYLQEAFDSIFTF